MITKIGLEESVRQSVISVLGDSPKNIDEIMIETDLRLTRNYVEEVILDSIKRGTKYVVRSGETVRAVQMASSEFGYYLKQNS